VKGLEGGGKERRKRVSKCSEEEGYITKFKRTISLAATITRARKGKVAYGPNNNIISTPPLTLFGLEI